MSAREKCERCTNPAAEAPKGEGILYQIKLKQESRRVTRRLVLQRFKFTPWTENPMDQIRMVWSDVPLCNRCAGEVWAYAQTPREPQP